MKRYRVTFRPTEAPGMAPKTEDVEADRWKVDEELVCLYQHIEGDEVKVFDVPKRSVIKIIEVV